MSRRHPPRVELGVGTALLVGGLGFLLVSLFSGFGPAWAFAGGVAAMTGAAKAYRAGRDLHASRVRDRLGHTPARGGGGSGSRKPAWTVTRTTPWDGMRQKFGTQVCSARCMASTEPRSTCRCPCGGTRHGSVARAARSTGNPRGNGGARSGRSTTGPRR